VFEDLAYGIDGDIAEAASLRIRYAVDHHAPWHLVNHRSIPVAWRHQAREVPPRPSRGLYYLSSRVSMAGSIGPPCYRLDGIRTEAAAAEPVSRMARGGSMRYA
jgi:hypothetical protein